MRIKLAKWNTPENIIEKKQAKIILLSQLIDVSSISCTINYTNMSSLRELNLGVSICLYMDLIKSLNIFSFKTKVFKTLSLNFSHGLDQGTQS
jgi:hypothetical protein